MLTKRIKKMNKIKQILNKQKERKNKVKENRKIYIRIYKNNK